MEVERISKRVNNRLSKGMRKGMNKGMRKAMRKTMIDQKGNAAAAAPSGRLYSLDLLRMVCMFMVAVLHVLGQGGVLEAVHPDFGAGENILTSPLGGHYVVAWFLEILCYGCVNVYAIISGYVGVGGHHRYESIIKLWLRVFFYSLLETILFFFLVPGSVGWGEAAKAIFPVMTNQYWYFTAYFPLFFLMPFLNEGMKKMEKKDAGIAIIATLILFSVLQTFFSEVFITSGGYSVLWLLVMYVLGAYIRIFRPFGDPYNSSTANRKSLPAWAWFLLFMVFTFGTWLVKILKEWKPIVTYISPTVVGAAICLFLCFEKIGISPESRAAKWIAFFSPMAFSVYLIHVHPLFWNQIFKGAFVFLTKDGYGKMQNPLVMGLLVLGCAAAIYAVCSILDIPRQMLEKKVVGPLLKRIGKHSKDPNSKT